MRSLSMTDFLWGLENSGWLKHIKAFLDAGVFIARAVADEGTSVLDDCSDGWDRTAQACSVASILLDLFYRTIKGLMVLIERDWVSFGQKFSHRYAHLDGDLKDVFPVIDQFLECVWQLSEQFPSAFEFNERFLIAVHAHVHSCQYGTFLGNSQKERRDARLHERSHSAWPQLWEDRAEYANPLYKGELSQSGCPEAQHLPLLLQVSHCSTPLLLEQRHTGGRITSGCPRVDECFHAAENVGDRRPLQEKLHTHRSVLTSDA
ncbi:phosphatidylinositol-3-phosphate phosphatase MTMR7-like [Xenentodon cancila]